MCGMYICFYTSGGILYTVNKVRSCASKKQYQRLSVMFPGPWDRWALSFLEFFCFLVVINFVFWFYFLLC